MSKMLCSLLLLQADGSSCTNGQQAQAIKQPFALTVSSIMASLAERALKLELFERELLNCKTMRAHLLRNRTCDFPLIDGHRFGDPGALVWKICMIANFN